MELRQLLADLLCQDRLGHATNQHHQHHHHRRRRRRRRRCRQCYIRRCRSHKRSKKNTDMGGGTAYAVYTLSEGMRL